MKVQSVHPRLLGFSTDVRDAGSFFKKIFSYLCIWLYQVFSCGTWTLSCGVWNLVPCPGVEPGALHWECRILVTGPSGKSTDSFFKVAALTFSRMVLVLGMQLVRRGRRVWRRHVWAPESHMSLSLIFHWLQLSHRASSKCKIIENQGFWAAHAQIQFCRYGRGEWILVDNQHCHRARVQEASSAEGCVCGELLTRTWTSHCVSSGDLHHDFG